MGFRAAQWAFNSLPGGLTPLQICLMQRAAWSCFDDTGLLLKTRQWLVEKCGGSGPRSFERDFWILEKLGLLMWNGRAFRLPQFVEQCPQSVGTSPQFVEVSIERDHTKKEHAKKEGNATPFFHSQNRDRD